MEFTARVFSGVRLNLGNGERGELMAKSNRLQNWYHNGITVGQRRLLCCQQIELSGLKTNELSG
jgi:hypothetical protein